MAGLEEVLQVFLLDRKFCLSTGYLFNNTIMQPDGRGGPSKIPYDTFSPSPFSSDLISFIEQQQQQARQAWQARQAQ